MSATIRAFIVVFVIAVIVFAILAKPAQKIISPADFRRWRNLWLAITTTAFVVGNFWVLMLATSLFVLFSYKQEPTKPTIYWLLLCVIPANTHQIPGFGLINYLLPLNMPTMLAIVVLLPAFLFTHSSRNRKNKSKIQTTGADYLIILYFILSSVLAFRGTTATDAMRTSTLFFLGIILPYFAFSRKLSNQSDIERAMLAYLLPMFVLGILGGIEALKSWKLYSIPDIAWTNYKSRSGFLRASTTGSGAIVFGYIMMIAIGFLLPLANRYLTRMQAYMAFGALSIGLVSSLSRGPWVGTVALIFIYISSGRNAVRKLVAMGFAGIMLLPFLALTPFWQKIVNLIPFIGTTEAGNIDYRQRLFEQSWIVINRNPLLGSVNYKSTPEMQSLIQGEGIIDIVNSYIRITLNYGFVGLFLFTLFFVLILWNLHSAYKSLPAENTGMIQIGRALFATLCAILITIATVSSVSFIPYLYWSVAGLAVAYIRVARAISIAERKSLRLSSPIRI